MKKQLLVLILAQLYKTRKEIAQMKQEIADLKTSVDASNADFALALENIAQDELVQSKKIDALLAQVEQSGSLTPEEKQVLVDVAASAKAMAKATRDRADAIADAPAVPGDNPPPPPPPPSLPPTPIA